MEPFFLGLLARLAAINPFFLGLVAGLVATPHCLGMCGGFAVHLSRGPSRAAVLWRHGLFHLSKTLTYAFLGALVGALGVWVISARGVPAARSWLPYGAGGLTVIFGALLVLGPGLSPVPDAWRGGRGTPALRWPLPPATALGSVALGVFAGFLPCPLTISLLVSASGYGSVSAGLLLLAGAGVGTVPGLAAAGAAGSLLGARWRGLGLRGLGAVVICLGLLTILRHAAVLPGGCCR
jgi:sulfite exporter TauE/SafE